MKLSEKGQRRIHEMIDYAFEAHPDDAKGVQILAKKYLTECDDFELESDDFEGCVVLTVEEARAICDAMNPSLSDRKWRDLLYQQITGYMPIHSTPIEGKLILPKQAEKKDE